MRSHALELAAIRHRRVVRRRLRVGDEELSALLYLAITVASCNASWPA